MNVSVARKGSAMAPAISVACQNGRSLAARWADRPSDEELLARYRDFRSQEAFTALVNRHGLKVIRLCQRIVGNLTDAEDVAQTVFLLLARRPELVRSSVRGWLHEMARGRAINELRCRRRRANREERVAGRSNQTPVDGIDLREEVGVALKQLHTRLRQAVVLRYVEGRSLSEAAQAAGCPPGTMGRRSQEGLRLLRSILTRRGAAVVSAVLAALTAHAKLGVAAVVVVTAIGLSLPPLLEKAPEASQTQPLPSTGIVKVQGLNLPYRCIIGRPGPRVYYQVDVPAQGGGTLPFTIGVDPGLSPAEVQAVLQERANLLLGSLTIPIPN